jgi:hypothetical protein
MKKCIIKDLLLACAMAITMPFVSCSDEDAAVAKPSFKYVIDGTTSPATLTMAADDVVKTVTVEATGAWSVAVSADAAQWLHVSPDNGEKNGAFTLTVDANTANAARTGTLTFLLNSKATAWLSVAQDAVVYPFDVSPETVPELPYTGGDMVFTVTGNADWDYTLNGATWLTETGRTESALTLTAGLNFSENGNSATITFSAGNNEVEITVSQSGNTSLNAEDFGEGVTPTVININAGSLKTTLEGLTNAGNYVVNVTGNVTLSDAANNGNNILLQTPGVMISLRGNGGVLSTQNDATILRITAGTLTLRNITLTKTGGNMPAVWIEANGTGIINEGVSIVGTGDATNAGVRTPGHFVMNGGEITGHRCAGGGGGLYVPANGHFVMNGGKIYNNRAGYGGGVFVGGGSVILNGGEFYDNHSTDNDEAAGAVYLWGANSHFEMQPDAVIYGKDGGNGKAGNTGTNGDSYGHAITVFYNGGGAWLYRSDTVSGETLSATINGSGGLAEQSGTWN